MLLAVVWHRSVVLKPLWDYIGTKPGLNQNYIRSNDNNLESRATVCHRSKVLPIPTIFHNSVQNAKFCSFFMALCYTMALSFPQYL